MPLTFAHPLAVVPLRHLGLPLSAMVVGSMIPDVVLFAPWLPLSYEQTHSPAGLVTIDLVLGGVAWVAWLRWLRRPIEDAAPAVVRHRLPASRVTPSRWWVVTAAILAGTLTHVLWDSFTHPGRWGTRLVPWLSQTHAGMLGAKWAQYTSGLVGVLALALLAGLALHRAEPRPAPRLRPRLAPWVLTSPLLAGALTAALVVAQGGRTPHDLAYTSVTRGGAAGAAALLLMTAVWHLAPPNCPWPKRSLSARP